MDSLKERNNKSKRTLSREENEILDLFDTKSGGSRNAKATPDDNYKDKIQRDLQKQRKRKKNAPRRRLILCIILLALIVYLVIVAINQPNLKIKGEKTITVEAQSEYQDEGATATFFGFNCSKKIETTSNVDTSKLGTYTTEYKVTKGGRTKTAVRTVNVVDTTAPVITLEGGENVTVSAIEFYSELGYSAIDNYDGDITASVQVTEAATADGGKTVTYSVTDQNGNKSEIVRTVTVKDIVPPKITLMGKETTWVALGNEYKEIGFMAVDDLDGKIDNDKVSVSGEVNTAVSGNYTLTYSATDASGNTATVTRTVKVLPLSEIPVSERYENNSRIYLTFDDGPGSEVTPRILDILKQYNIKATFFICNYSEANKALVQRAVAEGHSIGIHGYTHSWTAYSSDETYLNNITSLHDKLLADTGYDAKITRFLGGSSNTVSRKYSTGIMSRLAVKVEQMGYQYYDWNVSSGDAESATVPTERIIANVEGGLKPDRNNIVLMHDINSKTTTAEALPTIIEYGIQNGYIFLPITPDVTPVHHGINN